MSSEFSFLPENLVKSLSFIGFDKPTEIQQKSMPIIMGEQDILASSQTGSGKTGAFLIPTIARLMQSKDLSALVLTPTRELASQILTLANKLLFKTGISYALLIGGESIGKQITQLKHNPRLVIGTPGRVNDMVDRGLLDLKDFKIFILDEADRMLDMGFGPQIEQIVEFLPKERQTLMFSATVDFDIEKIAKKFLKNPQRVSVGSPKAKPVDIQQDFAYVSSSEKYNALVNEITKRKGAIIIFVNTKDKVDELAFKLGKNHAVHAIHGGLSQLHREKVIKRLRKDENCILIATDVIARGLDVSHIAHIINYDLPNTFEDYIHRIGRTARQSGLKGAAISFVSLPFDNKRWIPIKTELKKLGQTF